ncbi:MAG TPA: hypothetical protein VNH11_21740 [Pirellulales bacterium]|nr:hypothetical protein [Pirellulales bacterium]
MLMKFLSAVRRAAGDQLSGDVVHLYQSQRKATRRLMHEAMQLLTKSDLENAAKALGMWRRGVIVLDDEDQLQDWPKLGARQRSAVTALVIRCCLDAGSADRMGYA